MIEFIAGWILGRWFLRRASNAPPGPTFDEFWSYDYSFNWDFYPMDYDPWGLEAARPTVPPDP